MRRSYIANLCTRVATVTNVSHATCFYDSAASVETIDSITAP
jgi:hypothetical protein